MIGLLMATLSVSGQEIIPFPDLSEHYNFRNSGGEGIEENTYEHLQDDYRNALNALDEEILSLEKLLANGEVEEKRSLQKELEDLKSKRSELLEEAELQSDLLKLH